MKKQKIIKKIIVIIIMLNIIAFGKAYASDIQVVQPEYTKEYKFPIIKCNDFGHQIANGIIPIGVRCKIDSDNNKIEILDEFLN